MTWDNSKYIKLLLQRVSGSQDKWLMALRTTADYYGWTQEFPAWSPEVVDVRNGLEFFVDPGRRGEMFCETGLRVRISRSESTGGWPAGQTNQFKVSRNCGLRDLAEVAHFTQGDWHWMTSPYGERIKRARWEAMFQSSTYRRVGVMSRTRRAGAA